MKAVRPLPGIGYPRLVEALETILNEAGALHGDDNLFMSSYIAWADGSIRRLSPLVSQEDVDQLVRTQAYWALRTARAGAQTIDLHALLSLEIADRLRVLDEALRSTQTAIRRWVGTGTLALPDTNVYLHHEHLFTDIAWSTIVAAFMEGVHLLVPMVVVDELDGQKRNSKQEVRSRARQTLKLLHELSPYPGSCHTFDRYEVASYGARLLADLRLQVMLEDRGHVRLPIADDEIVDVGEAIQDEAGRPVHLLTFDTSMVFRAKAAGLTTHLLEEKPN